MKAVRRKRVPLDEQETTVGISADSNLAMVYSCIPATMKKLYGFMEKYPDECTKEIDDGYGVAVMMPASWISIQPKKKRSLTEAQKEAARARLEKVRKK